MFLLNKKKPLLLIAILLLVLFPANTFAEITVERIAGNDRFETAVEISKKGWETSQTVILTRSDDFPDALAGTPLAYFHDAPILLTSPAKLAAATKDELQRLNAQTVIILGGVGAVSQAVEDELKQMGFNIQRIGGNNRYETAALIASELPPTDTAIIANGENFPDALAIGPYAARNGYPILLIGTNSIPKATSEALEGISKTIIVGGPAAISNSVEEQLGLHNPGRIFGADRYETATAIVKELEIPTQKVYVATGLNFADALTGSALAAKENAPILLVRQSSVPLTTSELIRDKEIVNFTILGGPGAVVENMDFQYYPVTGVTLNKSSLYLEAGSSPSQLTAVVTPFNATNKKVTWTSSNTSVATVSNGLVTTVSPGTATIMVTTAEGGYTASSSVTVYVAPVGHDAHDNSLNNQAIGNYVFRYGDWLYYVDWKEGAVSKVKTDGSNKTVLVKKAIKTNLNVYKDWVYFIGADNGVYRVKTDGTGLVKLNMYGDDHTPIPTRGNLIIWQDRLYYLHNNWIYSSDLDGNNSGHISSTPSGVKQFILRGNELYFIVGGGDKDYIFRFNLSNGAKTRITSVASASMNIEGGWIYFQNKQDSYRLYRASLYGDTEPGYEYIGSVLLLKNQETEIVTNDMISGFIVHNGWVYYKIQYEDFGLYKVSVSGTNKANINSSFRGVFNISGNYIFAPYYPNIYQVNLNGVVERTLP